jgi:hypothetical protein
VDPKEPAGGQEEDFDVFARRFTVCVEATVAARTESSIVYVGDMPHELAFAHRLAARTIDIEALRGGGESNDPD